MASAKWSITIRFIEYYLQVRNVFLMDVRGAAAKPERAEGTD
jgi:hypothetical protein